MRPLWGENPTQGWLFFDRADAGRSLAARLERYRDQDVVVLGIPRGGVPVAAQVASHLGADLDVIVARKLGAPFNLELAIGAVTATGGRFLNDDLIEDLRISDAYLAAVTAEQRDEACRREEQFRGQRPACRVEGRVAILIDDGLATGATMRAAVRSLRQRQPSRLIVAVPVGSSQACAAVRSEVDELVCLHEPKTFWAVGLYYRHFDPTPDDEVLELLRAASAMSRRPSRPSA
jgi:putative phosphoribosyl transferase